VRIRGWSSLSEIRFPGDKTRLSSVSAWSNAYRNGRRGVVVTLPFAGGWSRGADMNNANLGAKSGRIIVRARTIGILNGGTVIRRSMSSIVRQRVAQESFNGSAKFDSYGAACDFPRLFRRPNGAASERRVEVKIRKFDQPGKRIARLSLVSAWHGGRVASGTRYFVVLYILDLPTCGFLWGRKEREGSAGYSASLQRTGILPRLKWKIRHSVHMSINLKEIFF